MLIVEIILLLLETPYFKGPSYYLKPPSELAGTSGWSYSVPGNSSWLVVACITPRTQCFFCRPSFSPLSKLLVSSEKSQVSGILLLLETPHFKVAPLNLQGLLNGHTLFQIILLGLQLPASPQESNFYFVFHPLPPSQSCWFLPKNHG